MVALLSFLLKLRKRQNRDFPDSIGLISYAAATVFSFSLCLSGFLKRKHLALNAPKWLAMLCRLQSIMLQASFMAFIWSWITSMLVVYQIVVKRRTVEEVRAKKSRYCATMSFFVITTTLYAILSNSHGELAGMGVCWVKYNAAVRILLFLVHVIAGMLVFILVAVPVVRSIHQARRSLIGYRPQRNVLKDEMMRQIFQAVMLSVVFTCDFLYWINQLLLSQWSGAIESTYIAETMFTYCTMNSISLASLGLLSALVHSVPYSCCQQCLHDAVDDPMNLSDLQHHVYVTVQTPSSSITKN